MGSTDVLINTSPGGLYGNRKTDGVRGGRRAPSGLVFGPITKMYIPLVMLAGQRGNVCRRARVPRASTCVPGTGPLALGLLDIGGTCLPLFIAAPGPLTLRPSAVQPWAVPSPPQQRDPIINKSFLDPPLPRAPSGTLAAAESRLHSLPERGCGRG